MDTSKNKSLPWLALETLASLRITVVLFVLSLFLVFYGTLAQVDFGIWTIVNRYFRSSFVLIPFRVALVFPILFKELAIFENYDPPYYLPFPGGWTLGTLLLVNLVSAHIVRFKYTWKRLGIWVLHAGLIIMMLGELLTGLYAIEGHMTIFNGQSANFVEHSQFPELAITSVESPKEDKVIAIPARLLRTNQKIKDDKLPVELEVVEFHANSSLKKILPDEKPIATMGIGKEWKIQPEIEGAGVSSDQRVDVPSMYVKIIYKEFALGTYLLTAHRPEPEWIDLDGKLHQVHLRFKRTYRDYSIHLDKFKHKFHPNTDKPYDFRSEIRLTDPTTKEDRRASIYMNNPLRYGGETFFQSSWIPDPPGDMTSRAALGTVLQVVRNPAWLLPYVSFGLVFLGMGLHFTIMLAEFIRKEINR